MADKKVHHLTSGNVFTYSHESIPGRGGLFTGTYERQPSEEDTDEAINLLGSLMPPAAVPVIVSQVDQNDTAGLEKQARQRDSLRNLIYGGSRN